MDTNRTARIDDDANALVVEHLTVRDENVIREAQRWTTGERGPVVDDLQLLAAERDTASRRLACAERGRRGALG
jgi:hypothetical protein